MAGAIRTIFCVSDHTGLTAANYAHSAISRFENVDAVYVMRPFADDIDKIDAVVSEIDAVAATGPRPIVFTTLTDETLRERISEADALVLGLLEHFVELLAGELAEQPSKNVGTWHSISDTSTYQLRLDALDFTLMTDDGLGLRHYANADIIIVGVSRAGKTPTCLYLSMQYGLLAANYPVTIDELKAGSLPETLRPFRDRLFGLTIDPVRLHQIRQKRRPDSEYSSMRICTDEVSLAERLFRRESIPFTDSTVQSIEEITSTIMRTMGLDNRLN